MSSDQYTREVLKSIVSGINRVAGKLDKLIGIADRPRKNDVETVNPTKAPTQEDYAAIGKMLFALHVVPAPTQENTPKKRWYNTIEGRKNALEKLGIFFAIGYAIVTFCQWRDLRNNFFIEQKSFIKYEVDWPTSPTSSATVGVNITNIGKLPVLSAILAGHIEIIHDTSRAILADGNHPASIDIHSFIFPNDPFVFSSQLFDDASGKPRGFTDQEISDLIEGRSYIAIFGLIKYRDELGSHWLRFCDWHNYSANSISNALDCVQMNDTGDGSVPAHPTNQHYWENH